MQTIEITQDMVVKLMLECDAKKQFSKMFVDHKTSKDRGEAEGFVEGARFALDTLGIYIDGINWDGGQTNVEDNEASRG